MARCDTYVFGECTWGCCETAGWVPEGLGDAGDWALNAPAYGLQVTLQPTVGSVVSYARGDGYSAWGHCGYVLDVGLDGQFLVYEMNYVAWDTYNERWSSMWDVAGFILAPGSEPGQGAPPPGGRGGPSNDDLYAAWGAWAEMNNNGGPQAAAYISALAGQINGLG